MLTLIPAIVYISVMENILRPSTLIVPNEMSYLLSIQAFTRETAIAVGFEKSDIEKILLALEEAVTNVIEYAYEKDEKATFDVLLEPLTTGLKIIVKDKGLPFYPDEIKAYTLPADIDHVDQGLGSFLMKKAVDELIFHNLGREGKELHLIKFLPYKSIVEYGDPLQLEPFPEPKEKPVVSDEAKNYQIRLMDPSEAFDISKLFYRAYGYSYGIDSIYYPDRFSALLRDGSIISVVTVADGNKLVGHAALVKDDPHAMIAEAAMAVVQPEFRGCGCQSKMLALLVEEARKRGLVGIFSKAVTNHVYAQRAGNKAGFKRVALVVGLIPADRSFKGIHAQLSQRESVAYGFLPIANPAGITLYPPDRHRQFVEKIFIGMGLDRVFARPPQDLIQPDDDKPLIKTTLVSSYNRAAIEVHRFGRDTLSGIKAILKELRFKKIDEIMLYLNLADPRTAILCDDFEKMGFFIAGVLPFSRVGDALILQYLNNVLIDYDKIQVASELLEEIRDYVRDHDPNFA